MAKLYQKITCDKITTMSTYKEKIAKLKDKAYQAQPIQKKRRAQRNKARRAAIRKYGKTALVGKDIDHKDGNPMNGASSNLRVMSVKKNRGRNNRGKNLPSK
jgi:hypothetical protein